MTTPTILAVDPGARQAGAVVRRGRDLKAWVTVLRDDPTSPVAEWAGEVCDALETMVGWYDAPSTVLAVEGVNAPSPHMGMTNVAPTLDTAWVAGAVGAWGRDLGLPVLVVPPARHGAPVEGLTGRAARQVLLQKYPDVLVGPRETTGSGKGHLQHARAAWDVAGAAALQLRLERGAA